MAIAAAKRALCILAIDLVPGAFSAYTRRALFAPQDQRVAQSARWLFVLVLGCSAETTRMPATLEPPCLSPVLFGHRGTTLHRPENTLPAFEWALEVGGDGIEVDVRLSADDEIVVIHDSHTGRTTDDAQERKIADLSLAQIKALDAGAWFDPAYAGTRVPTLGEVVEAFPDALLLLDLKGPNIGPAAVAAVLDLGIAERTLISAFDETLLTQVHAALPDVPIVYFLDSMQEVSRAPETGATYLRIPDAVQDDPAHMETVIEAGYLPAVGGTYVQWNGSLGLANSMKKTVQRRSDRRPPHCAER